MTPYEILTRRTFLRDTAAGMGLAALATLCRMRSRGSA